MTESEVYQSCIIGAGPAGVALVGRMLEINALPLIWIDPDFNGGKLANYPFVQSNTLTKFFVKFVEECKFFDDSAADELRKIDGDEFCDLCLVKDMICYLTRSLKQQKGVNTIKGIVKRIDREEEDLKWNVDCEYFQIEAYNVFFATGSTPKLLKEPKPHISLETVFNPSELRKALSSEDTVAVIGSSYSTIIALRNLSKMEDVQVKLFSRSAFKFSEQKSGYIKYENNGLKGNNARWARDELPKMKNLKTYTTAKLAEEIENCTKVIYTVGFERFALPLIGEGDEISYDPFTAEILQDGKVLSGLFGFGIAFPEKIVDPDNEVEFAVGIWKFLKHAQEHIGLEIIHSVKKRKLI